VGPVTTTQRERVEVRHAPVQVLMESTPANSLLRVDNQSPVGD
jgi:hypothetical protein